MLSLLLAAAVATAPATFPDDADKASLLASVAKTRAYLAGLHKPTLTLLGRPIATERFRRSAARFEALVKESWGTPQFDQDLEDQFELVDPRTPVRFTGYHLPLLEARAKRDATYRFPLYAPPTDMLAVPLGTFKPTLAGTVLTGRVKGTLVVPYFTRTEIDDGNALANKQLEVAWVADELGRYSLMVQGSGMLHFDDGRTVNVNYAGQNGHPYTGLGKALVADGKIPMAQLSMPTIEAYFKSNPDQMHGYLNRNPSYVFFKLAPDGPFGSDGIALTSGRSIATDKSLYPSGAITYVKYPRARFDDKGQVAGWDQGGRFVCDQDTGGAITGPGRVDIFYGGGQEGARRAGTLNGMGTLSVLLLKE
ncbi:MAG: MltA domain protein [Cyanobacteria bacterium RYN_339]|nr:MltA domain protein [Cyanobacteria bacterium RYN_339]